jgi:hypothetical protein
MDMNALPNANVTYFIRYNNKCEHSAQNNIATTVVDKKGVPPELTGISISASDEQQCNDGGVRITWPKNPTDWGDSSYGTRTYDLLRDGVAIGTGLTYGTTSFTDNPDSYNGPAYSYEIRYNNGCGISATTAPQSTPDYFRQTPTPSIAGLEYNPCPTAYSDLATESGMLSYQWYKDNQPIDSANGATYRVTESGVYSVAYSSYPGCWGRSAFQQVEISLCPNLYFDEIMAPSPVTGFEDGDGVIEPGERWSVEVEIRNDGPVEAKDVQATLNAPDFHIYYNPGYFGDIPSGGTGSYDFEIIPKTSAWYYPKACGIKGTLNLTGIHSNAGRYVFNASTAAEIPVGALYAIQSLDATYNDQIQNTAIYPATIPITVGSPTGFTVSPLVTTASVTFTLYSSANQGDKAKHLRDCVIVDLAPPNGPDVHLKERYDDPAGSYTITDEYNLSGTGIYTLKVWELPDCPGAPPLPPPNPYVTIPNMIAMTVERLANCDTPRKLATVPDQGTDAGGTSITLYGASGAITNGAQVYFDFSPTADCSTLMAAESVQVDETNNMITLVTPRAVGKVAGIKIDNPDSYPDICQPNTFYFKTLGFTANQVSQDVGVIDTTDRKPFAPKQRIPFPLPNVPMGMALSKGTPAGREFYVVDSYAGALHFYDAANLNHSATLQLQAGYLPAWAASEIEVSEDGTTGYVLHITDGDLICPAYPCESSGSISVVDLAARQLVDIDYPTPGTTSPNAPEGISRIEVPDDWHFLPLSAEDVYAPKPTDQYLPGEKWPGEYLFVSGAGMLMPEDLPAYGCAPGQPCPAAVITYRRPLQVAVVDLNPSIFDGFDDQGNVILYENPAYREFITLIDIGEDNEQFEINQGLDFNVYQDGTSRKAYVYAVSPSNNHMMIIDFDTLQVIMEGALPLVIPTGINPSDVRIQAPLGVAETYAYISNAGDDSITVINTAPPYSQAPGSPISLDSCRTEPMDYHPTAIGTRVEGDYGFTADFTSGTTSVVNLVSNACETAFKVGDSPIRIVLQPSAILPGLSREVQTSLAYAEAADFTEPSKQGNLLRDWEHIVELQETSADPQAVLSNLDNFQGKIDNWVTKQQLKDSLNDTVDLYRVVYTTEQP